MTEKELIQNLKSLRKIKPRQEWVVLTKSQIFAEPSEKKIENWGIGKFIVPQAGSRFGGKNWKLIIENSFSRKLAYSFATLLFIFVGLVGFAQYTMPGDLLFPVRRISEQSQAALSGQTGLKQDAAALNSRINDLAQAAKQGRKNNIPSAISEINAQASALAKDLKNNPVTDSETLKEIAISLKVLADVPGADLSENPNVKDLYQAIVENQLADMAVATLTEEQAAVLSEARELYEQQDYVGALEKILEITN